jgi:hypothetical protein
LLLAEEDLDGDEEAIEKDGSGSAEAGPFGELGEPDSEGLLELLVLPLLVSVFPEVESLVSPVPPLVPLPPPVPLVLPPPFPDEVDPAPSDVPLVPLVLLPLLGLVEEVPEFPPVLGCPEEVVPEDPDAFALATNASKVCPLAGGLIANTIPEWNKI